MRFFFRQTVPETMPGHVGADGLKKPHQIITLSFSEVFFQVEVQAKYCKELNHQLSLLEIYAS